MVEDAGLVGSDHPPITVLVIDDHQMVAESILRLLRDEPDMDVLGVATTAREGLAIARERHADVVVMDYNLPDLDGVAAARELRTISPTTTVVMLTGSGEDEVLLAAIDAGCSGYIEKSRGFSELARGIRLAASGDIVLPPARIGKLLPRLLQREPTTAAGIELTVREREVLTLMGDGLANKAIALQLGVRLNTVRNHVQNLLQKLGAHSKLEAVAIASRAGLIE